MKKNILVLLFISLLLPTFVWGMDNKQSSGPQKEIIDLDLNKLPDDENFLCKSLFIFCIDDTLFIIRLGSKRLNNCVAFFTHNERSFKVKETPFCGWPDGQKTCRFNHLPAT